ncbi:ERG26 [Candida oxycetoniae]|uniref:Sterol-4-alpha-carboxylate 3-dehydrogenase ERG26, decarboxylating n=1 Tax=Candida oxycetoniae TaxID=497107 RepID=A0AAI9T242_9ASCO|nr:ERG26 [Candida oxycetoniae]KAI3406690.2 ERG26 [Candida oxycetoniae]
MSKELNSVLLIGGAGFLGLHLIQQFYTHCPGIKITVFDIRPIPSKLSKFFTFDAKEISFFEGDLTSTEDVGRAIKESQCDVIVHSASPMHGLSQAIYEKVNVEGTRNLLQVAKNTGIGAFVYTSSAGVIFNGQDVINADESWPYPEVHMDGYNETKAIAETAVMKANDPENGFRTICLRPAGIFGPGDRQLVPGLKASAELGQSKYQLGDNNNLFDWTYVGNVADAHVLAAKKLLNQDTRDKVSGETFFITNDSPTYFWTLARTVWKNDGYIDKYYIKLSRPVAICLGYISEFVSKLLRKEPGITPFRVKVVCAVRYHNISKAKRLLDYEPKVDLETGIINTLDWMNEKL